MENNEKAILENQDKLDTKMMKKIKFSKDQIKKLDIMTPFYYNDDNKDAISLIAGKAIEHYFQHKFVEDIKNLSAQKSNG